MVTLYGRFNPRLFLNYGSRYDCIAMSAIITQLRNLIGLAKYLDLGVDTCKPTRVLGRLMLRVACKNYPTVDWND